MKFNLFHENQKYNFHISWKMHLYIMEKQIDSIYRAKNGFVVERINFFHLALLLSRTISEIFISFLHQTLYL
jgi:hypothetical protein